MNECACRTSLRLVGLVFALAGLAGCSQSEAPDDAPSQAPEIASVKTAEQAVEGAHLPTLDAGTLNDAEIGKVIPSRPRRCTFRYTNSGRPVFVASLSPDGNLEQGLVKLNGSLVPLEPGGAAIASTAGGFLLMSGPVRVSVQLNKEASLATAAGQRVEADMVLEVDKKLRVGYGGYLNCAATSAPAQNNR